MTIECIVALIIILPSKNSRGYLKATLSKDSKLKHVQVHRLVALAFISNPEDLPEVNHIDECKSNDHVSNLEWCTSKYNANYGTRNGRICKSNGKPIVMCDKQGNELREFDSTMDAERFLDKPRASANISKCCRGERETAYGYKWKYKE